MTLKSSLEHKKIKNKKDKTKKIKQKSCGKISVLI